MWPNWTPPDDIEIDGHRRTAPIAPNPPNGPDTDLLTLVTGHDPGVDPAALLPPYVLGPGANAQIPAKGVSGVGPQTGNSNNDLFNRGSMILPGWQRYLQIDGQNAVGILPRTVPVVTDQLWDAKYVLNPGIEVV
jgi:hypothetical protein